MLDLSPHAQKLKDMISVMDEQGLSLQEMADYLNKEAVVANTKSGKWTASHLSKVRIDLGFKRKKNRLPKAQQQKQPELSEPTVISIAKKMMAHPEFSDGEIDFILRNIR